MSKQILCLDFDGVCSIYTNGWKGADVIVDPPVKGALAWIREAMQHYDVKIFSSRSHQPGGREAMSAWFRNFALHEWGDMEVVDWFMSQLDFPLHKPPAFVTIDDRALTFDGTWPSMQTLKEFKPWNKK